ncbi:hypothetical protein HDV02_000928 [Globomyces sp. JEL0801]|nr:hypothetical protein HDV02_000928 [Globomyces sp. JEL0801]
MGIMLAVVNSFPFAIVGRYSSNDGKHSTGLLFGMMNMVLTLAQFFIQFVVIAVPNLTLSLLIAGILAGISSISACYIVEFSEVDSNLKLRKIRA